VQNKGFIVRHRPEWLFGFLRNDCSPSPEYALCNNSLNYTKLSDCRGLPASGCVAADTRKMLFRYSQLCGTASDAVDVVRLAIPTCWVVAESEAQRVSNFKYINQFNSLKIKDI